MNCVGWRRRPDRTFVLDSKVNDLQGSDIYRINALIKNVKLDQPRAILKYTSSSFPLFPAGERGRPRSNGERLHNGTLSLVGWSDAAYGDLSQNGKCRLGYLIGVMFSSLSGPCHILQWTSKFTRELVKSSLGGGSVCLRRDDRPYDPFATVLWTLLSYFPWFSWNGRLRKSAYAFGKSGNGN